MNEEMLTSIVLKIINKSKIPKEDNYGFAIVTVLMMISIVLTCVRILQECNKSKLSGLPKYSMYNQEIKVISSTRGWFTKMKIKKLLRSELTPENYKLYNKALLEAILDIGETLTEEETITLMEAANV
jgi:hypothetical protein